MEIPAYWRGEVWANERGVFLAFKNVVQNNSPNMPLAKMTKKIHRVLHREKERRLPDDAKRLRRPGVSTQEVHRAQEHACDPGAGRNPAYAVCERKGIPQLRFHG